MPRFLLPLLLAACTTADPAQPELKPAPAAPLTTAGPTSFQPAKIEPVRIFATMAHMSGVYLKGGQMCTADGCTDFGGSWATTTVQPMSEIHLRVSGPGTVERHVQTVVGASTLQPYVVVPTVDEAEALAAAFDVEMDPRYGTLIQYVDAPWGPIPTLSTDGADGPFYLDPVGTPLMGDEPPGNGYYVFFNVEPGLHRLELFACDEGESFWGNPGDGAIDVEMQAGAWLSLFPVRC